MPISNDQSNAAQGTVRRLRLTKKLALLLTMILFATLATGAGAEASGQRSSQVVVANRGSGDISVVDTQTLDVQTIDLPGEAEPMYVSHDRRNDRVIVGDRASDTVVALDQDTYEVVGSAPVGEGVFHQWLDPRLRQLWVVGDTSNTVTVIGTDWLDVLATIDIPADLTARGGKPHDVFVSGRHAFVSILGLEDGSGVVLRYSTRNFTETGRIATGGDPHLFVDQNRLYVASQESSSVTRYRVGSLREVSTAAVPNAHGIFVTKKNEVLVTNIAGGGTDAVWELNARLSKVRDTADTSEPTPHNLTVDDRRQAWVTHSGGTANRVSVIDLDRKGFGDTTVITVGTNPFGLAFVR